MRDIIERLKQINEEFGYIAFAEHFKLSTGHYCRVNKDDSVEYFYCNGSKDDPFLLTEDYKFFKNRLFFEGMLNNDANKAIDTKLKKIHSVTPNAMIFKYGIFNDSKLKNKGLTYKDAIKNHLELINKLNNNSLDIELLSDKFIKLFKNIEIQFKEVCKDEDKILIVLDDMVDNYKQYYENYLKEKIFIKNETIKIINGIKYGVSSFNMSLNNKKPTLSKNPYNKYPIRISFADAMLLNYLTKIKSNQINKLLLEKENPNEIDLYITPKDNELNGYNLNIDKEDYQHETNKITIIQSEYINEKPIKTTLSRQELLDEIDWNFNLEKGLYLFNRLLSIRNGVYKDFNLKCNSNNISSIFISNKEILKYYFNENGDILIDKELSKIMFLLYLELIKRDNAIKSLRMSLDFMLTTLDYVNKDGGYDKMPEVIQNIWNKLIEAKKSGELVIDSNEEFFFIGGQLLYWLSTLNETANNTSLLLQDVLDIRCSLDIKNKAIDKYKQYAYKIPVHSLSFINVLYNAVVSYEIDKDIKIKDFKYKYYYHSGLVGKNIKFESIKKEKLEGDKIDEE